MVELTYSALCAKISALHGASNEILSIYKDMLTELADLEARLASLDNNLEKLAYLDA